MTEIIKVVTRFGRRGGHICLPQRLIGKQVMVVIEEIPPSKSYDKSYDKPQMSYDKQVKKIVKKDEIAYKTSRFRIREV